MALTFARVAFAGIAALLILPIIIASVVVACLVYPCVWLSVYKATPRLEPPGKQSDQDLYSENQLQLARLWELEGR